MRKPCISYPIPNGEKVKLLDDKQIYLGMEVEREFAEFGADRIAGLDFLLVCECGEKGVNPEIIIFKKR